MAKSNKKPATKNTKAEEQKDPYYVHETEEGFVVAHEHDGVVSQYYGSEAEATAAAKQLNKAAGDARRVAKKDDDETDESGSGKDESTGDDGETGEEE